jgi:hypothetical protein
MSSTQEEKWLADDTEVGELRTYLFEDPNIYSVCKNVELLGDPQNVVCSKIGDEFISIKVDATTCDDLYLLVDGEIFYQWDLSECTGMHALPLTSDGSPLPFVALFRSQFIVESATAHGEEWVKVGMRFINDTAVRREMTISSQGRIINMLGSDEFTTYAYISGYTLYFRQGVRVTRKGTPDEYTDSYDLLPPPAYE